MFQWSQISLCLTLEVVLQMGAFPTILQMVLTKILTLIFSDYGGFQSFVHGVPASFNSHDVNSRLHFQKGTIPALLNTLGLAREATGQVLFIMKKLPQFC